ncbi:ABC transporter permease subunit [Periweissella cryptocerci]|uniref:ABC transporter permease subunit n=2 Tax=Periweissella cryptocerci TaxID=2506420 RepID=A0A4P6YX97_9LACO|nr:ABC transporter permease subunit [Periweissella cryptocerci]
MTDNGQAMQQYFGKRKLVMWSITLIIVGIYVVTALFVNYDSTSVFTTVPKGVTWLLANFVPTSKSMATIPAIIIAMIGTVGMSVSASLIGAVFALFAAIVGSAVTGIYKPLQVATRIFASFFRNIPLVAWAMILLFSFKQNDLTGFLALFFTSFGYLTRAFMETIEDTAGPAIEALKATGASYWQIVFRGVVPMAATSLMSWLLYMVENNVRDATLVGMLTGTGIGFLFDYYYKSFDYDVVGIVILVTVVVVVALEMISNKVRRLIM